MRDEWPVYLHTVHLHIVYPPIGLSPHRVDPAALGRATAHGLRFDANNVLGVESIQRFLPCLLACELNHFIRDFLSIHIRYMPNISIRSIGKEFNKPSVVLGRS